MRLLDMPLDVWCYHYLKASRGGTRPDGTLQLKHSKPLLPVDSGVISANEFHNVLHKYRSLREDRAALRLFVTERKKYVSERRRVSMLSLTHVITKTNDKCYPCSSPEFLKHGTRRRTPP